jgi:hypothetical protein
MVDFWKLDENLLLIEWRLFNIWFEEVHCRNQTFLEILMKEYEIERRLRELDARDICTERELLFFSLSLRECVGKSCDIGGDFEAARCGIGEEMVVIRFAATRAGSRGEVHLYCVWS